MFGYNILHDNYRQHMKANGDSLSWIVSPVVSRKKLWEVQELGKVSTA
jgi:hypothetical protein